MVGRPYQQPSSLCHLRRCYQHRERPRCCDCKDCAFYVRTRNQSKRGGGKMWITGCTYDCKIVRVRHFVSSCCSASSSMTLCAESNTRLLFQRPIAMDSVEGNACTRAYNEIFFFFNEREKRYFLRAMNRYRKRYPSPAHLFPGLWQMR